MKNKICSHKNIKQTKIFKYFNMAFILNIIKLIIMCSMAICVWTFIIFHITYMSHYKFFSYDLLSLNNIWLFAYMFLSTSIFSILAVPINIISFYSRCDKKKDGLFYICCGAIIFFIIILTIAGLYGKGLDFVLFCIVIASAYFIFIESCVDFYFKRQVSVFIVVILIPMMILTVAIANPQPFNIGFENILKGKSLAADKVEIYLKDKNQFIIGKMVFRDSKFAYVVYDDRSSNNNGADSKGQYRANKLVPIENVTILNPLPQDSTLQK